MYKKVSQELLTFLQKSPTAFHAVKNMKEELNNHGYQELNESKTWKIVCGGKYYVIRNQSSIIAFQISKKLDSYHYQIVASHSDCPTFKIKENGEIYVRDHYIQLNTEGYGGMICPSWFDRPLSVAGRVFVQKDNQLFSKLIHIDKDLVLIPNVAIHMNRKINNGYVYNNQVDMLPLFAGHQGQPNDLKAIIANELGIQESDIYGSDLYLYNRTHPSIWGAYEEFISSSHLDDLQCAYASLKGFLKVEDSHHVNVFACFDNEEVGSQSQQGAASTFLTDVLKRLNNALGKSEEDYYRAIASTMVVSADNAHAVHPNHPEKSDVTNQVYMNKGIVIKSHAGQKYTSDATSIAIFKKICENAQVPIQFFANKSDQSGGSTLGHLLMSQVSAMGIDIGLPQLAMHSAYETAGVQDTAYLIEALTQFYKTSIEFEEQGVYTLR